MNMNETQERSRRIPPFVWLLLVVFLLLVNVGLILNRSLFRSVTSEPVAEKREDSTVFNTQQGLLYEGVLNVFVDGHPLSQPALIANEGLVHYAPAQEFLTALDGAFWAGEKESLPYTPRVHEGTVYLSVEEFCGATGLSACLDAEGTRLWCTSGAGNWTVPAGCEVPVLWYHGVGGEAEQFVSVNMLDWQIYTLLSHGYTPIRLEDLKHADQVAKPVILCFDGGDAGIYEHLYPLLQKYGIPVMLFVDAGMLNGETGLSSSQLRELADSGYVSVQCRLPQGQEPLPYKAALLYETDREPFAVICSGETDEETLARLRSSFRFCLSVNGEVYVTGSDPMRLSCMPVTRDVSLDAFSQRFS